MKKFLPYIFILIVIVGIFGIIQDVKAEEPKGTCYRNAGEEIATNVTEVYCMAAPPAGLGGETWGANTTPPDPSGGGTTTWDQQFRACMADGGSETDCRNYANATASGYKLLEPLPCKTGDVQCENGELAVFDTSGTGKLGQYLNVMITLFIGLCAVLAVIMIVIGGIEYSTSELVSSKAAAKDRIQSALLGLLLALMSWLLLNTINPDLLRTDFDVGEATLGVSLDPITIVDGDGNVTTFYSSSGGGGGGRACSIPTNPNNPCHPSHLSCFGARAQEASRICMAESGGISQISRSDRLNNGSGPGYSMGIWQINLTVHRIGGLNCPSAFTAGCGPGNTVQSGPRVGNCSASIRPGMMGLYQQCVAAASDPILNRQYACRLFSQAGFRPWGYSARKCGVPR